jgi:hypothetical protein
MRQHTASQQPAFDQHIGASSTTPVLEWGVTKAAAGKRRARSGTHPFAVSKVCVERSSDRQQLLGATKDNEEAVV